MSSQVTVPLAPKYSASFLSSGPISFAGMGDGFVFVDGVSAPEIEIVGTMIGLHSLDSRPTVNLGDTLTIEGASYRVELRPGASKWRGNGDAVLTPLS